MSFRHRFQKKTASRMDKSYNLPPSEMTVSGDFTLVSTPAREMITSTSSQTQSNISTAEEIFHPTIDNLFKIVEKEEVIFHDVQKKYAFNEKICCSFSFLSDGPGVKPGDIIALSKLNCNTSEDVVCSVPADKNVLNKWMSCYTVFLEVSGVNEHEHYKLCYIQGNIILGTSMKFSFGTDIENDMIKMIHGGEYIAVEDPEDPSLVVFKSKISQSTVSDTNQASEPASIGSDLPEGDYLTRSTDIITPSSHGLNSKESLVDLTDSELWPTKVSGLDSATSMSSKLSEMPEAKESYPSNIEKGLCDFKKPSVLDAAINTSIKLSEMPRTNEPYTANIEKVLSDVKEVRDAVDLVAKSLPPAVEQISRSLENLSLSEELTALKESAKKISSAIEKGMFNVENKPTIPTCEGNKVFQVNANGELLKKIEELEEDNAFLKSRTSVLELELSSLNKEKYTVLMKCINSYEEENAALKKSLDEEIKKKCTVESLNRQCETLEKENEELKQYLLAMPLCSSEAAMVTYLRSKCDEYLREIQTAKQVCQDYKDWILKYFKQVPSTAREIILKQTHEIKGMRDECKAIKREVLLFRHLIKKSDEIPSEIAERMNTRFDSIEFKCERVIGRNIVEEELFYAPEPEGVEKVKLLHELERLRMMLFEAEQCNAELRENLNELRKQSIGKISLHRL